MAHFQYQGCNKSREHKGADGTYKWWAVKVNKEGECILGDDASRTLIDGDQMSMLGMVANPICKALINSGKCPAKQLQIS